MKTDKKNSHPSKAGSGVYRKGKEKKELILKEAINLFSLVGPSEFSVRSLANRLGTKTSSIQHYFPSRTDLMCAIVEYYQELRKPYEDDFFELTFSNDVERLDAYINFILKSQIRSGIYIYYALLAEAVTSTPELIKSIKKGFSDHLNRACGILEPLTPQLTKEQRMNRAVFIVSAADGLKPFEPSNPDIMPDVGKHQLMSDAHTYLRQIALMP